MVGHVPRGRLVATFERVAKPGDERDGPAVVFDDPSGRLFFADMTGDGLQDIVRIEHGAIHYWPNLGRGVFGRRITMQDSPQLAAEAEFDPRRVRLADIDGSGTTDVIYLDHRGARAWFNLSGNGFSEGTPLRPFPRVGATTAVEVVDLLGKGTACLMWSERGAWAGPDRVKYLDLMGDKPHLLVSVDNGMGLQTRVRYEASTAQALRDRANGQEWITRLPFPVYVVTRVEQYDQVARRRFVQYRTPRWLTSPRLSDEYGSFASRFGFRFSGV